MKTSINYVFCWVLLFSSVRCYRYDQTDRVVTPRDYSGRTVCKYGREASRCSNRQRSISSSFNGYGGVQFSSNVLIDRRFTAASMATLCFVRGRSYSIFYANFTRLLRRFKDQCFSATGSLCAFGSSDAGVFFYRFNFHDLCIV